MTEHLTVDANTIDIKLLEEQYGSEFVKKLNFTIGLFEENNLSWKLEVLSDSNYFITFALTSWGTCKVIEVQKGAKRVTNDFIIGRALCEKIIETMNSFN